MTAKPRAASRAGLAPAQRPAPPPVDPRLRPWYERCKNDHDRLATIASHGATAHAVRLQYEESKRVELALSALHAQVQLLTERVQSMASVVESGTWQPQLALPDLPKLPDRAATLPVRKRGSKPAASS